MSRKKHILFLIIFCVICIVTSFALTLLYFKGIISNVFLTDIPLFIIPLGSIPFCIFNRRNKSTEQNVKSSKQNDN